MVATFAFIHVEINYFILHFEFKWAKHALNEIFANMVKGHTYMIIKTTKYIHITHAQRIVS